MRLNLDIWHEIISLLDYPGDGRTLCSLAVTSRDISKLALDALWWNGGSGWAIVSVINSFSSSLEELFLQYTEDDEDDMDRNPDGSWVLNKPIPSTVCERARGYLARIKNLSVGHSGPPKDLLWPILSASLKFPRPLLSNLKILCISFHVQHRNEYLIPLLSPSLNTLVIHCQRFPRLDAVLTFLNLAKIRGCDLEDLTYYGAPDHRITEAITLFNNLQRVWLPLDQPSYPQAPITIIQFLKALPSLRLLHCHIGTFLPSTDEDQFCHTNLKEIVITFQLTALELFRKCVFPSVTNATLRSIEPSSLKSFVSSCPDTCQLGLDFRTLRIPLEFTHLVPLLSLPLQSFSLSVQEHTLTMSNLRNFAHSWPNIRALKIASSTLLDPLLALPIFSNYPCLNTLTVPLSLGRLLEDIPEERNLIGTDVTPFGSSNSPLRALRLGRWGRSSLSTVEKRVVAEHLLRLFPSLVKLHFIAGALCFWDNLQEFWEIFREMGREVEILLGF